MTHEAFIAVAKIESIQVAALNLAEIIVANTLPSADQTTTMHKETISSVRRLTPTECERLQNFPVGWTLLATAHSETPSPSRSHTGLRKG